MKIRLLLTILFITSGMAHSQLLNIKTSQLWMDFRYFHQISDSLDFVGEVGYRVDNLESTWRKIYINPQMRWTLSDLWGVRAGLAVHYTDEVILPSALEIRPWQGGLLYWPRTRWFTIEHYFRIEERINITFDPKETTFDLRLRYRIAAKIPVNILTNPIYRLYIPLQYELFSSQEDNIIERYPSSNRFVAGLGFRNGLVWGIDANYIYQHSGLQNNISTDDHILRIRLRVYNY